MYNKIWIRWSISIGPSPLGTYAEARAILEGFLKCLQMHMTKATLHIDSSILLSALIKKKKR